MSIPRTVRLSVMMAMALAFALAMPWREVEAGWLTRIGKIGGGAGEAGVKAGKVAGLGGALGEAATLVSRLPPAEKGMASLAAHATPEGHWKFVNRDGEVFTAANADELARMTQSLAPELAPSGKLSLYLTDDAVFAQQALLKDLPAGAELHLVSGNQSYKLVPRTAASGPQYAAEIRPNVRLDLTDADLFREATFHLARPLKKSSIRLVSLTPGGPKGLGTVPRFDPVKKTALVDEIDPAALTKSFANVKGQTVMLTGRLDAEKLVYRGANGVDEALDVASLRKLAEDWDVNLVLLNSPATRQPGGRNWMWQKVKVSGLDEALENKTFADFLDTLGASQGPLSIAARQDSYGRVALDAAPLKESLVPVPEAVTGYWDEFVGETTGHLAVRSVHVFGRDQEREKELDARVVPGIPSWIQGWYLIAIAAGLISWQHTTVWWARIWPPERRDDYRAAVGYHAARIVRTLAYIFLFLPFAGLPGLVVVLALQLWEIVLAPFRFIRWIGRKLANLAGRPA